MKWIFSRSRYERKGSHIVQYRNSKEVLSMRICLLNCLVILAFLASFSFTGCVTTFTPAGQFQVGLSPSANETAEVLADFEASEEAAVAGDISQKAGSSCAGGVCTIY